MPCECNLVINELLCFLQNKCDVMDELSLVQICSAWYNEEEIECAKTLLCELVKIRKVIRKGDKRNQNNISDVIKTLKESEHLPTFAAKDLNRLPSVTFDHLDVSSLLKTLATLKNELLTYQTETRNSVSKLECEIKELKEKRVADCCHVLPATQNYSNDSMKGSNVVNTISNNCNLRDFSSFLTKKTPVLNFSQAVMSGKVSDPSINDSTIQDTDDQGFRLVTRKRKRPHIENYQETSNRPYFQSKNKRGTNGTTALKAAEQIIPVYISRFCNDCTETDIQNYFKENERCLFGIETLKQKKETNFKSFKILVAKKDLSIVLKEDFWPESIVFRVFKQRFNVNQGSAALT
ncbi:unnamed protein product [Diatraea saccharalis]|uniref:Uncharacterized protein n=1 Tax=Diatraea saccharalis TaxID=40085 RepID=A0A9N9WFE8_9NEOP|nr:unnamed protein product [Diatraea saccharalis]